MDNFNILVSGGDQDEDLVSDGWTDIIRNLLRICRRPRKFAAGDAGARRADGARRLPGR